MTIIIAGIIVLAAGVGFLIFFIVKSSLSPHRIEALSGLLKKGKTQTVIKAARRLISKDPRSAEAHYYLGCAYLAEKREELAVIEFKTVNQLGISGKKIPEVEFRRNLAQLFIRQNQGEEALKEFLLLIKLEPNRGEYYYQAGKLFSERGNSSMARDYLGKAAELTPKDSKVHFELGLMLYRDKKPSEAKAVLQQAQKMPGENAGQIHFYLGKILKDAKDFTAAAADFEKAARDPAMRLRALVERGGCFMALNAMERAIPDLERAVKTITDEAAQDSLYARYFLAACYENQRDIDKAITQWEMIASRKKNFRDVAEKLSQYQELRDDDNMKDYMTASQTEFSEMCQAVVSQGLNLHIIDAKVSGDCCEIRAIEGESAKWRNTRKMPRLIRFYRGTEPLDEEKVRSVLEDAKSENIPKTALFTGAGLSRSATDYASSRSVELFGKEQLAELLKRTDPSKLAKRAAGAGQARG
ncbi:MAG TPA: restriction endonuclease [Treponema sp.]|nr:restriction endonuclease [Treponema sp.]